MPPAQRIRLPSAKKDFLLDRNPLQIRCGEIQGWKKCVRLSNGVIELIGTLDVGPRIIRFGFVGDENQFCEFVEQMGKTDGEVRRAYGGTSGKATPRAV